MEKLYIFGEHKAISATLYFIDPPSPKNRKGKETMGNLINQASNLASCLAQYKNGLMNNACMKQQYPLHHWGLSLVAKIEGLGILDIRFDFPLPHWIVFAFVAPNDHQKNKKKIHS